MSDLGVKASVEFVAEGQDAVIAQAEHLREGIARAGGGLDRAVPGARGMAQALTAAGGAAGGMVGSLLGALNPIGAALAGFAAIQQTAAKVGREVEGWTDGHLAAARAHDRSMDALRTAMREIRNEQERDNIGLRIRNEMAALNAQLGDFRAREAGERAWERAWDEGLNFVVGFDLDEAQERALLNRLHQLRRAMDYLPRAPVKAADLPAQDWEALHEKILRAQRGLNLGDAHRAMNAPGVGDLEKFVLATGMIGQLKAEAAELEKARQTLAGDLRKAVEAGLYEDAKTQTDKLARVIADLNAARQEIAGLERQIAPAAEEPGRELPAPDWRGSVDRLTRIGATLGDPRLPGPGNLGRGKDAAWYQERANAILAEIRDEMRANRRAHFNHPGAYED